MTDCSFMISRLKALIFLSHPVRDGMTTERKEKTQVHRRAQTTNLLLTGEMY